MHSSSSTVCATVGILTYNSATTLERALASVKNFAEIIICDGGSTDATRAIAEKYGARIIEQDSKFKNTDDYLQQYAESYQQILDTASNDWFLYIDSDTSISDGLREDIRRITSTPARPGDALVYRVPTRSSIDGHEIKYSSNYPEYRYRFFNKKSGAHFVKSMHEHIAFDHARVSIGTLTNPSHVYTTREESKQYVRNTAQYRALEIKRGMNRSLVDYFRFDIYRSLRESLSVLFKSLGNYLLHGFKDSAPIQEEIGRALSPLYYLAGLTWARITRKLHFLRSHKGPEPEVLLLPKLLAQDPNKIFIDVGSNVGSYIAPALTVLSPDKIYACEPNPQYKEILAAFGVVVEQIAFSSKKGTSQFKVPAVRGTSYPTRGTLEMTPELGETGADYFDVETTTLDDFVLTRELSVGTIKIDVEGHEQSVLAGAQKTLKEQHPSLIVEIEQRHHQEPIASIFQEITQLGYDGYFYDTERKIFAPLSDFVVTNHQARETFKTPRYINNFVFVPTGATAPAL